MTEDNNGLELKKALLIFLTAAVAVIAAGIIIGEAFIWDKFNVVDPLEKDIQFLESAAKTNKDNNQILVELGWLYYRKGDYQESIKTLTKAIAVNRLNPQAHYNLGLAYQEAKLLGKAEQEYQKTLELDPESQFAYFSLGKLYFIQENWDGAIDFLKLAVKKDPASADNYYWLGQAYQKKGYKAEALAAYQKVLAMIPNHKEAKEAYYRLK